LAPRVCVSLRVSMVFVCGCVGKSNHTTNLQRSSVLSTDDARTRTRDAGGGMQGSQLEQVPHARATAIRGLPSSCFGGALPTHLSHLTSLIIFTYLLSVFIGFSNCIDEYW
jgi:hypothetical protein